MSCHADKKENLLWILTVLSHKRMAFKSEIRTMEKMKWKKLSAKETNCLTLPDS